MFFLENRNKEGQRTLDCGAPVCFLFMVGVTGFSYSYLKKCSVRWENNEEMGRRVFVATSEHEV